MYERKCRKETYYGFSEYLSGAESNVYLLSNIQMENSGSYCYSGGRTTINDSSSIHCHRCDYGVKHSILFALHGRRSAAFGNIESGQGRVRFGYLFMSD